MSASQIRQLILDNGIDLGCSGHDSMFGYGRSNALASALEYMHVDFNSMGGSAVNSQLISYNEKIAKPTNPSKHGLALVGWYKEEACMNEWNFAVDHVLTDITLYAKWGPPCEVTFNSMGGSPVSNQTIGEGGKVVKPEAPINTGYVLLGWYMDQAYTIPWDFDKDVVTEDVTLYALWGEMLDGSGTEADPYLIDNAKDLAYLAHMVNTNNSAFLGSKYYLQTADIDLSILDKWIPIGWKIAFDGTYDGSGYTINGLNVDIMTSKLDIDTGTEGKPGIGLFGKVEGVIKNTHLNSGTVNITGNTMAVNVGSIAGSIDDGTIENCSSAVDITQASNDYYNSYGGVAGSAAGNSSIIGCTYSGDILGAGDTCDIGGILGYMDSTEVSHCDNSGSISAKGVKVRIGGIVGSSYGTREMQNLIGDCRNKGELSASCVTDSLRIGGIAAKVEYTNFTNCQNSGSIIALDMDASLTGGGIVADLDEWGSITECNNTGDITCDKPRVGGLIGSAYSSNFQVSRCYNVGNIYILSGGYELMAGGIAGYAISHGNITECYKRRRYPS